jgi:hypothetical protein
MSRDLEQTTERWLAAESQGDEAAAEAALRSAFQRLPAPAMAPDFTDQVMARVAEQIRRDPFNSRRVRGAIAAAFLAAASLLLVVGQILRLSFGKFRPFDLLDLLSQGAVAGGAALRATEGVLEDIVTLSSLTAHLLTTPPALIAVIGLSLILAGAFRLLKVFSKSRGVSHVDAL